jgi:hypothetical protein
MKMRVLICSLVLIFTLYGYHIYGQTIEKSRRVSESFKLAPDTEVELINKYGNVHIIPWKKDSVRFDIELMVKGSKQSKVDKSFDYIEFDFKTSKYYVIAQTLFAGKSSFWSDVSDLTGAIFNSSTKTKIDYTVYLPADVTLKIKNKYGNIYTTDHTGNVDIELSNGDLKAYHFSGNINLKLEFGNATIKQIDKGMLQVNYGEIQIEEAGVIEMESKSSKFYIDEVKELEINSKRDKFYLQRVGHIHGITNFSLIEVDAIDQKVGLNTTYGDLDLKSFTNNTESIGIKSENTDIILHFTDSKVYEMEFVVDEKTQVMYSTDITDIVSSNREDDKELIDVKCTVGTDKSMVVPVKLDSRGGTISLKLK